MLRFTVVIACWAILSSAAFGAGRVGAEKGARGRLTRLAAGFQHTCAILDDGSVWCWGDNSDGQLGDGTNSQRNSPVRVTRISSTISIAAGAEHTCALS